MKQKIFLTSALAMGVFAPAMAEPTNTGTFPNDGYMQEDYKYTEAATEANMGVYEGNVNAIAEYTEIPYSAAEGFYLTGVDNNNEAITAECTSGNFCPGVASTTYENNAFGDTGLQSCSTATSGAYTLSDAGASSSGQCYRTCNGNVSILHATGVTGNDYSDGTNTCSATGCENGWHTESDTLHDIIGTARTNYSITITNTGEAFPTNYTGIGNNLNAPTSEHYGLSTSDVNSFGIEYSNNVVIRGSARCSTVQGDNNNSQYTNPTTLASLTDEAGQNGAIYCYCKLDGYKTNNTGWKNISSSWVFLMDSNGMGPGGVEGCATQCSVVCTDSFAYSSYKPYKSFMFSAIPAGPASCEANTITINWGDTDLADVTANEAGTATYGSDIRTPVKAQTKAGKRFIGWRFSAPEQTTTGN